jgi:hypothetical protein
VGLGRLRQREGGPDAHTQLPGGHASQDVGGASLEAHPVGDVVKEHRTREEERALLGENQRVDGVDGTAGVPEQDHHPPGSEAVQTLLCGDLPHPVVDHVHALAVGETTHRLGEVLLGVEDHLVGSRLPSELRLLLGGDRAQDAGPGPLCHLNQEQPHPSGGGVYETGVTALQGVRARGEIVGGETLEHHRGRVAGLDLGGNGHRLVLGNDHPLRVGAGDPRPGDAASRSKDGNLLPDVDHDPGALQSGGEGQRVRVEAGSVVHVDEVQPRRLHPHQELARARGGLVQLGQLQDLGTTVTVHADGSHGNLLPSLPV